MAGTFTSPTFPRQSSFKLAAPKATLSGTQYVGNGLETTLFSISKNN